MIDRGLLAALQMRLQEILQAHPGGLSEYELIGVLQSDDQPIFDAGVFHDSLKLFRAHFLLFHALYDLRERLLAQRQWDLHIEPLRVQLRPYVDRNRGQLSEPDALRAYYLDPTHLEDTGREDIEAMLGQFWSRLYADDHRAEALRTLELEDPVDYETIRSRYRELVMRHHPDRGGETVRLQELNEAMRVLARLYGS